MEFEKMLPIITAFLGMIIGSIVTIILSYRDRKQRKELIELEISQKKELFEIEKKQNQVLFELERKDKFRLVAVEKRLDAHQQALSHWYKLKKIYHKRNSNQKDEVLMLAKDFWINNSIYLGDETRKRFIEFIDILGLNIDEVIPGTKLSEQERQEYINIKKENWNKLNELHTVIFSEVALEPIKLYEKDKVPFDNQDGAKI